MNNTDLEFIKTFSKITVKGVCLNNDIKANNIWSGKASAEQIHKVRKGIEKEIAKLYITEL